ncbi:hypothetical protein JXA88_07035 [Candidatus Fermentibacteria bacterium]|nr:hypothetical protein [Candidatus Fermentibacteria bacterium]
MRRYLALVGLGFLACASGSAQLRPQPTDLEMVSRAAAVAVDSVTALCKAYPQEGLSLEMTGGGEGAWLVRSLLEGELLGRGFALRESGRDSTTHTLHVRIVELGVRHRKVDRRGIMMKPWVLRDGSCSLVARLLGPGGDVIASTRAVDRRQEWTPAVELAGLSDPVFTPSAAVPTSPGVVAPMVVAGVVGTLLALFFVTSE